MLNRLLPILLLGAGSLAGGQDSSTPPEAKDTSAPPILQRVVCVGASASGGYGWSMELKTRVKLGLLLDQMLPGKSQPCLDLGDAGLFQNPPEKARLQIERALEAEASLVVGIDFLFWFAYLSRRGQPVSPEYRLERLELGLSLLEKLKCPLLIGDLPDMSLSLTGKGPFGRPLLLPSMIPSPEEFEVLNGRIYEWVAARENTVLVPMHEFARRATEGELLEVRGNRWDARDIGALLQKDLLHPTVEGTFGLLVLTLDRLVDAQGWLTEDQVRWDVKAAHAALLEATSEERELTLERERKREERRKEREARKKEREREDGGGAPLPVGQG